MLILVHCQWHSLHFLHVTTFTFDVKVVGTAYFLSHMTTMTTKISFYISALWKKVYMMVLFSRILHWGLECLTVAPIHKYVDLSFHRFPVETCLPSCIMLSGSFRLGPRGGGKTPKFCSNTNFCGNMWIAPSWKATINVKICLPI